MTTPFSHRLTARAALLCLLAAAVAPLAQAACNSANVGADTPDARFSVATETVTDLATGLVWKRCAEGLSGAACATGTALTATWSDALARVATVNAAGATLGLGSSDWRLPNRNELASLVERQCGAPAINASVFPATPAVSFWTASPYTLNAALAWYVDYNVGDVAPAAKTGLKAIRLVRAGN